MKNKLAAELIGQKNTLALKSYEFISICENLKQNLNIFDSFKFFKICTHYK